MKNHFCNLSVAVLCLLGGIQSEAATVQPQRVANAVDGGVNFLLSEATQPRTVTYGYRNGRRSTLPRVPFQVSHSALTTLSLMSAGYETCDHTAEGFGLQASIDTILQNQNQEGYWGAHDNSAMYGHGLALMAIGELLVSGQPLDNRRAVTDQAAAAGSFSLHNWHHGVWPATPGSGDPAGTLVSTLQVMGLMSLFDYGALNSRGALRATDAMFENTVLEGGHHHNGTFARGTPLFSGIFLDPVC